MNVRKVHSESSRNEPGRVSGQLLCGALSHARPDVRRWRNWSDFPVPVKRAQRKRFGEPHSWFTGFTPG